MVSVETVVTQVSVENGSSKTLTRKISQLAELLQTEIPLEGLETVLPALVIKGRNEEMGNDVVSA